MCPLHQRGVEPLIVSASRRTDIPAFYAPWFMNRVREGHCLVPNPFNRRQVSRVSLLPGDVDAIVFWTRHSRPLHPHLKELDRFGHRYLFLYTLTGYPRSLERSSPPLRSALKTFKNLAEKIGPERVIWRYDPLVCTSMSDVSYHRSNFSHLAASLKGHTQRCIVSFLEPYRKTLRGLKKLEDEGVRPLDLTEEMKRQLLLHFVSQCSLNAMELMQCAPARDFSNLGVLKGKCIHGDYLETHLGVKVLHTRDRNQRTRCGCAPSKDVGMYNTCLFGCRYCYATGSHARALENHRLHDPSGPMLIPSPTLCPPLCH